MPSGLRLPGETIPIIMPLGEPRRKAQVPAKAFATPRRGSRPHGQARHGRGPSVFSIDYMIYCLNPMMTITCMHSDTYHFEAIITAILWCTWCRSVTNIILCQELLALCPSACAIKHGMPLTRPLGTQWGWPLHNQHNALLLLNTKR